MSQQRTWHKADSQKILGASCRRQLLSWLGGKEPVASAGDTRRKGLISGSERFPGEGNWQPTLVFLPGEFHGQRSLVGYSPWGRKSWTRLSN